MSGDNAFPYQYQGMIPSTSGGYPDGRMHTVPGMTKRELFAAMAMQGLITNPGDLEETMSQETLGATIADWAVGYADALLRALEKSK